MRIGAKNPLGFGLYAFGGIGVFITTLDIIILKAKTIFDLRPLRKGQGQLILMIHFANDVTRGINYKDYAFPFQMV